MKPVKIASDTTTHTTLFNKSIEILVSSPGFAARASFCSPSLPFSPLLSPSLSFSPTPHLPSSYPAPSKRKALCAAWKQRTAPCERSERR